MSGDETLDEAGVVVPVADARLRPGAPLGRYVVLETLGSGGMGVVYGAYDPELDRRVAVKLLHDDPMSLQGSSGRSRLLREAQALARLSHPNVVAVHDAGTEGDRVFVAMEFIHGKTLREWMKAQSRSVPEVLDVFTHAGRGLVAAHDAGLIHRDFKPENVMIGDDGRVRVMDFGLARTASDASGVPASGARATPALEPYAAGESLDEPLTMTGAIMGTPAYMAPEQHLGKGIGPASDQFAFCVSLYEALYGQRPFEGARPAVVAVNVVEGNVREPPAGSRVPPRLRSIVLRGLHPDPAERWPSMEVLLAELQRRPERRRAVGLWGAAGGSMLVAAALLSWPGSGQTICTEGEAQIAETWNASRRRAAEAAFEETQLPLARITWPRVESALDEHARAWVESYRDACEDTHVRHQQSDQLLDLRMECLHRRRAAMDALISVFTSADEAVVENALQSTRRLGSLDRCADRTYLLAAVPPPADADTAAAVEGVRSELARSDAARQRADPSEALAIAEQSLLAARNTEYAPVVAEAALMVGQIQARLGRNDEAEAALLEAWWTAIGAGHDETAIGAATAMVELTASDFDRASRWAADAWAFVTRRDPGDRVRAALLAAESSVHAVADRQDEAERLLREAVAKYERVASDEPVLAIGRINLSGALSQQGRFSEALTELELAHDLLAASLGADHPNVTEVELRMGNMLGRLGRGDEALAHLARAAEGTERAFGPHHPNMGRVLSSVATTLSFMARHEDALEYHERGHEVFAALFGHDSIEVAHALGNWGVTLDFAGRYAEARDKHEAALAIFEARTPSDGRAVASALGNLGSALQGLGEYDRAIELHRRALPLWEARVGEDHPDVGIALRDLSRALLGAGRAQEAVPLLERAVTVFSEAEVDPLEIGESRYFLGQALASRRKTREHAQVQLDLARTIFEDAGDRGLARLDALERWANDRPQPDVP